MAAREHNQRYEATKKAEGWVRGPRITADAAEHLRILAFRHRLDPCEVVSRLLLGESLGADEAQTAACEADIERWARGQYQRRHGLSDTEMVDMDRLTSSYSEAIR